MSNQLYDYTSTTYTSPEYSKPEEQFSNCRVIKGDSSRKTKKGKSKNPKKVKKERQLASNDVPSNDLLETKGVDAVDEVYSGDEDYSKGMKKWTTQYHQSRPGLKVLQERIDDFIVAHEAREEQARAEKLAQAAEGGWTVVVHQKGRKKSTEAVSGIVVGSVSQAAVIDKLGKKKKKDVGLDFYQFNRREAHRTEIMMLQSKFEQDKKRIQEMRAARKFWSLLAVDLDLMFTPFVLHSFTDSCVRSFVHPGLRGL